MGILRVDHPDIEAFIASKTDLSGLNNFNISVALTSDFMDALESGGHYDMVNPRNRKKVRRVSAKTIFDQIVQAAWESGEPGIVFLDKINEKNPTPHLGRIEATNPCGEQPLLPYESCNLGSINLSRMVTGKTLDSARLKRTVHQAVHFLDNVIEINRYPLTKIEKMTKKTRKIGLGVMGFADMLIQLGIAYDSKAAVKKAEQVMSLISRESRKASSQLAKRRGNFPAYKGSVFDNAKTPFMRNATTTTIAPTGSISIICGCSSGVEPLFAVAYRRTVLNGETLSEVHPLFNQLAKKQGVDSAEIAETIAETGSVQQLDKIPQKMKRLFVTAHDMAPKWHIEIQAAFQKYTDNAVSKTVNFAEEAVVQDVEDVFRLAYQKGCKGVTVYRYGSRGRQVLNVGKGRESAAAILPRTRPVCTKGATERINTGCGKLYVTINEDDEGVCEVFAQMGKTGGCASSQIEAAGRLISLALRSGVRVEAIVKQLTGIRCPSPIWQNGSMVLSCPDAIAQVIQHYTQMDGSDLVTMMGSCPDCGNALKHEGGCLDCPVCGFSKCS
jgi:ribonucleoside-diphosphate reductase alpha chain